MLSIASAMRCAEECQKVDLPLLSSQVSNFSFTSFSIGLVASQTCPLISAAKTLRANPSEIDLATSNAVLPFGASRTAPSGSVIFICSLIKSAKINKIEHSPTILKIGDALISHTMKKIVPFLFLFCFIHLFSATSFAQDLTGIWRGYFISEGGEQYK